MEIFNKRPLERMLPDKITYFNSVIICFLLCNVLILLDRILERFTTHVQATRYISSGFAMLSLANLRIKHGDCPNSAEQPSNEIVDSQVKTEPAEDIEDVEVLDADNNIDNDNLLENEGRNERLTTPSPVKSRDEVQQAVPQRQNI